MKDESRSGGPMAVYWGQSRESFDGAVAAAVEAARNDLGGKSLEWMEVLEFRGRFTDGELQYQTAVRIGYG